MRNLFLFIMLLSSMMSFAQKEIPLYNGTAPGSEKWDWKEGVSEKNLFNTKVIYNVVKPSITPFLPPFYLATGTAVIIAPGGGYHTLSINSEGIDLAKYLNSKGVAAFVLKYRLVHSETDDPVSELMNKENAVEDMKRIAPLSMQDGLKAVEYVRDNAKEFDVDPNRIGFIGFSAGGSVTLNVAFNATDKNRPNFIAPIYTSNRSNMGKALPVPKEEMPLFLAVASDDELKLTSHSVDLYNEWIAAGQGAELHIYEKGGHGFGMRTKNLPSDKWYERLGDWMHMQGYLKKLYPNKYEILYGQDAVAKGKEESIKHMQTDYAFLKRYKSANDKLPSKKKDEKRVVFLGNSITEVWRNVDSSFFAENNFIGRGISGQTSPQLLLRFRQDVIDLNPEAVVIHIGTNDIAENTGPYNEDFTMSNIQSMVELARANDIKVILASVLPATIFEWRRKLGDRSEMIVDLNARLKSYADNEGLPFVDYHAALKNNKNGMDKEIAEDGVHPTTKGYELMKAVVLPIVKKTLSK